MVRGEKMKKQTNEVECEECLVVNGGEYFLEVLDSDRKLTIPVSVYDKEAEIKLSNKLFEKKPIKSGKFPVRRFTEQEKANIQESELFRCPDKKTRTPLYQDMLNRMLDNTFLLIASWGCRKIFLFERDSKVSAKLCHDSDLLNFTFVA